MEEMDHNISPSDMYRLSSDRNGQEIIKIGIKNPRKEKPVFG